MPTIEISDGPQCHADDLYLLRAFDELEAAIETMRASIRQAASADRYSHHADARLAFTKLRWQIDELGGQWWHQCSKLEKSRSTVSGSGF